jgi:hypothetical protein
VDQVERGAVVGGAAVRVGEAVGHLARDEQGELGREAQLLAPHHVQGAAQITTLDVLDGEEVLVADAPDLEDLRDVDVLELDGDLGLVDEARDELLVLGEVGQHLLDHAQLLEAGQAVLGEEDLTHPAAREALDQEVATEHLGQRRVDLGDRPRGVGSAPSEELLVHGDGHVPLAYPFMTCDSVDFW